MENPTGEGQVEEVIVERKHSQTWLWVVLAVLITALVVGGGVYGWMRAAGEGEVSELRGEVESLKQQIEDTKAVVEEQQQAANEPESLTVADEDSLVMFPLERAGVSLSYPVGWGLLPREGSSNSPNVYDGPFVYQFNDVSGKRRDAFIDIRLLPPNSVIEYEPGIGDYVGDIALASADQGVCGAINTQSVAMIRKVQIENCLEGEVNGLKYADFVIHGQGLDDQSYKEQARIFLTGSDSNPGLFIGAFESAPVGFTDFLNQVAPIDSDNLANNNSLPDQYAVEVLQTGGVGSRQLQSTVSSDNLYFSSEGAVKTSFNRPGDLVWIACADGYEISSCVSLPDNQNLTQEDVLGCGLFIEDKLQNKAQVDCAKK